jgi:hypothetical protein
MRFRLLRQPLFGFIAVGALVFVADRWLHRSAEHIALSGVTRAELAAKLAADLGRPASEAERAAAEERWFDEEVLLREALSLGLSREDSVIRNHLVAKLRHIVRESAVAEAPTDAELQAVYQANPARYTRPLSYSLSHVFILNPSGQDVSQRVNQLLGQLEAGAEPASLGDHFPRGSHFDGLPAPQLEATLDLRLESVLLPGELKKWHTLLGARGTHLVRLDSIAGPELEPEALRAALLADYLERKKTESLQQFTQALRKKYPGVVRASSN